MDKRKAREKAITNSFSIGELRKLIADARHSGGMSHVNPQFTLAETCDIFERALAGRDAAEIPEGTRYDVYKRRDVASRDALTITNILRDCA